MAALEEIVVKIGADVDELLKGMNAAEKATEKSTDSMSADLKKLSGDFRKGINTAGAWGSAVVAASAAAAAAIVASSIEQVGALDRASQRLGESVEVISAFAQAAKSAGLDQESFADALQQTTIQIADFVQTGGGGATDFFTQLGIDARILNQLKPSEQLLAIADAIKDIPESDALKFLDDIGSDNLAALLPILKKGGESFRQLAQDATDAGLIIRQEDVLAVRLLSAELKTAQGEVAALGSQFTGALTPFIIVAVDHFKDLSEEGIVFVDVIEEGFKIATTVIGTFADGLQGIEILFKSIEVGASGLVTSTSRLVAGKESPLARFIFGDDVTDALAKLTGALNEALGLGGEGGAIPGFAAASKKVTEDLIDELESLAAEPLASSVVEKFSEKILGQVATLREKIRKQAEADAKEDPITIPVVPEFETGLDTLDVEDTRFFSDERLKQAVVDLRQLNRDFEDSQQTQLETLTERFDKESSILTEARARDKLTEEQFIADKIELNARFREEQTLLAASDRDMLVDQRESELEALEGFLEAKLITEQEFEERRNAVNRKFSGESIDLAKKEAVAKSFFGKKTTTDVIDGINALGQINEKAAKAAFRINQAKAVSDTIVTTAAGIQRAFADLPFPVALGAAAAIAASGVAQLATITSQSFEGGGGSPTSTAGGGDSGGAAPAGTAVEEGATLDVSGTALGIGGVATNRIEVVFRLEEGATTDDLGLALGRTIEQLQGDAKLNIPPAQGAPS